MTDQFLIIISSSALNISTHVCTCSNAHNVHTCVHTHSHTHTHYTTPHTHVHVHAHAHTPKTALGCMSNNIPMLIRTLLSSLHTSIPSWSGSIM